MSGGATRATPAMDREDKEKCWGGTRHRRLARLGASPALQVAEVQQVELPAVLAVVDVVNVLPR